MPLKGPPGCRPWALRFWPSLRTRLEWSGSTGDLLVDPIHLAAIPAAPVDLSGPVGPGQFPPVAVSRRGVVPAIAGIEVVVAPLRVVVVIADLHDHRQDGDDFQTSAPPGADQTRREHENREDRDNHFACHVVSPSRPGDSKNTRSCS